MVRAGLMSFWQKELMLRLIKIIDEAMDRFRRKATDLPWINKAVRKKIRRKMEIYRKEGRSELREILKERTDEMKRR